MLKFIRPRRIEWYSYFTVMPVLAILLNLLLFGNRVWQDADIWMYSFPLVCLQGFGSWYLHIIVMHWLRNRFPLIRQTTLRLSLLGIIHMLLTTLTFAVLFYSYDAVNFLGYTMDYSKLKESMLLALALTMLSNSLWESDYTYKQLKDSVAEKEKLEQLTLKQEFETLKSQVNPHFLFNCFNTLSSLITEDRKQAEVFLNELSKVYRYLLRNNEDGLSTLQTEIKFIESYYKLLRTRHGEAVQLTIDIDKKYERYLLPSLSLQMLVENAVKHNVLSRNKPLLIEIFTTAGARLVVNNNLQARTVKVPSNRIGLENISSKYALLSQPPPQVLKDARSFTVVLPLIWSKVVDPRLAVIESQS